MQQETLRGLRLQSGKTVAEVADKLGVTPSAVCQYEKGARCVGLEQVLKLAEFYDNTAEEIIKAQLNSIAIAKTE